MDRNPYPTPASPTLSSRTPTHSPILINRLTRSASTAPSPRKSDSLPRRLSTTIKPTVPSSPTITSRVRRHLRTPKGSRSNTPDSPRYPDNSLVISVSSFLDAGIGSSVAALLDDIEAVKSVASSANYKLRTNIGLARAFVRLALEKKRLSAYLKVLLSDAVLLRFVSEVDYLYTYYMHIKFCRETWENDAQVE